MPDWSWLSKDLCEMTPAELRVAVWLLVPIFAIVFGLTVTGATCLFRV